MESWEKALNFFIYDTVKIFILLTVIVFIISVVRTFFPPEKTRKLLARKHTYKGNILASLLGIVTPFCSCSAVPLFLGFLEAGVPLGATFSFLVASPMINEVALIMLLGMFGWKIALIYVVSGLVIAVVSGLIIGRMKVEGLVRTDLIKDRTYLTEFNVKLTWMDRFKYASEYTVEIIKKVWIYIIIGIGIGAWIHGYVPTNFLAKYAGAQHWYAVPFATLLGIPLYSNAAGIIPLLTALTEKGVAMGTALAFMMSVTALSFPEFVILRRIMRVKLIVLFAGIVGFGIMLTGFLFNLILG